MFSKINFTYKKPAQNSQSYLILREQLVKQKIKENEKKSLINCISLQNKIDPKKVQNTSDTFEQSREKIVTDINKNIEIKLNDSSSINTGIIDNAIEAKIILTDEQIHDFQESIKNSQTSLHNKVDSNKIQNTRDIFEQSREIIDYHNINNNIEIKLNDSSTINTGIIDDVNKPEIILTEEQLRELQAIKNSCIIEIKLNDSSTINTGIIDDVNKPVIPLTEEQLRKIQAIKNKYINDLSEPVEEGNFNVDSAFSFIENTFDNKDPEMYDNIPIPFNVSKIHKRGIKIINNVYQSKYEYGKENSTGLGDFLRGCYFILEFCEKYNFQSKIIFNNCISKFLLIKTYNIERIDHLLKGISGCKNNNVRDFVIEDNAIIHEPLKDIKNIMVDFVDYVVKSPQYSGNVFMYCNSFPIDEIPEKNKEYMRKFLEATNEMKLIINRTLDELTIATKEYIVIHIRSGDSYLKEEKNTFSNGYIYKLINNIKYDVNGENKYLLIADSNDVKIIIQKYFPNFKTLIKPITHFGEGVVLEEEKVKNTLIDFYLLSHSKTIFSYSSYKHGSGFSYWCAKTFNIPYVCKYIQ